MKKILVFATAIFGILLLAISTPSCTNPNAYKDFLSSGPLVYPGKPDSIKALTGRYRIMLTWRLISDQTITGAIIYWNNKSDSLIVPITRTQGVDTIKVIIDSLQEQTYDFQVYTFNKAGDRSVVSEISGKSLGENYEATLINWGIVANQVIPVQPPYFKGIIVWDSYNIDGLLGTKIEYVDADNIKRDTLITYDQSTAPTMLDKFVPGDSCMYAAEYIPDSTAIDTFYAAKQAVHF